MSLLLEPALSVPWDPRYALQDALCGAAVKEKARSGGGPITPESVGGYLEAAGLCWLKSPLFA